MSDDHHRTGGATDDSQPTSDALAPTLISGAVTPTTPPQTAGGLAEHEILAGRYELLALVGYGGMGNVYKAHDRDLDEIVALKTLTRELTSRAHAVERFRAEVKLARRVTHRNVVRTFDLGSTDEVLYLTMEFVDGHDLSWHLASEGRMSLGRFVRLARPICDGLQAAHDVGVVHRDLKPSNVILGDDGRVVVTDFGIARATREPADINGEGMPVGTPAYMAPEQVLGKAAIDHRADIYALGVMFYEMLAGRRPFDGKTPVVTALARLNGPTPDLGAQRSDLPSRLIEVVCRCLAREPGERYDSVGALAAELDVIEMSATGSAQWRVPTQTEPPPASAARTLESLRLELNAAPGPDAKTLAVMPFRYQGEGDGEYLADGLTEEIIDDLSMSRGLKVRPRGAVMGFKGTTQSPREVGRALSVQLVVDGVVRRIGERVRVRVALISVDDGFQVWAKRFEGTPGALFDISEQAAQAVAEALMADDLALPRSPVIESAAVEIYMQARRQMHQAWFGDLSASVELFERALQVVPDDARLLSGAAIARARAAFFGGDGAEKHLQAAADYAERAIAMAGQRSEPHLALARVHFMRQEFGHALASLRAALTRSPSCASSHDLMGRILREIGPIEAAIRHMETALELDPHLHTTRWDLAQAHALAGHWQEVDELLALDVDTDDHLNARESARTRTDLWRDRPRWLDADDDRPISPASPHIRLMSYHRRELMRTGEFSADYHALIDEILAETRRSTRLGLLVRQVRAENHGAVGEVEQAIATIEDAVDAGLLDVVWLEHCACLDALRADGRFQACVASVRERVRQISRVARATRG